MRRVVAGLGAAGLVGTVLLAPVAAGAATAPPPAQVQGAWSFDSVATEGSVADVSGSGRPVALSGVFSASAGRAGTGAVRFASQSFGTAVVPAPGTAEVSVTVVLRSLVPKPFHDSPNVMQDGLFNDPSQIKIQLAKATKGEAQCRVKGSLDAVLVTGPNISVTDGAWHTVTCWRQGSTVGVTVDGKTVSQTVDVGTIAPVRPMTVAARGLLPGDLTDQFLGDLDAVVWASGDGARGASVSYANALVTGGSSTKKG